MSAKQRERLIPTAGAVTDAVAALNEKLGPGGRPNVAEFYHIVEKLLGFDPSYGKDTDTSQRGTQRDDDGNLVVATRDGWINEHLSVTALRRVLDALVADGTLIKLTRPPRFAHSREEEQLKEAAEPVSFPWGVRSGWVLATAYGAGSAAVEAEKRNQLRDNARKLAEKHIIEKYADEVQAVYIEMCRDAGLDPERETEGQ